MCLWCSSAPLRSIQDTERMRRSPQRRPSTQPLRGPSFAGGVVARRPGLPRSLLLRALAPAPRFARAHARPILWDRRSKAQQMGRRACGHSGAWGVVVRFEKGPG